MLTLIFKNGVVLKTRANRFTDKDDYCTLYQNKNVTPIGVFVRSEVSAWFWTKAKPTVLREATTPVRALKEKQ